MKKILFIASSFILLAILGGCHQADLKTKYYPYYTKDDILLAGKMVFLIDKQENYIIDSYRDRLEVTNIELLLNIVKHKDYVIHVDEDVCGTKVNISITGTFGTEKKGKYDFLDYEYKEFWKRMDLLLNKENNNTLYKQENLKKENVLTHYIDDPYRFYINKKIVSNKDKDQCYIRSEFDKGIIKDNQKDKHENNNTNL